MAKVFSIGGSTISYGGFMLRELGSGSLTISKTVSGSGFDPAKTFELTVTFSKAVTYNGTTSTTHTFNLANGQSVTITGIPELTEYTVVETPLSQADLDAGYSISGMTGGSGTVALDGVHTAAASNGYIHPVGPYSIRLLFEDGYTPTFSKGTATQFSVSPNIWDLTYENSDWSNILFNQSKLLEIIQARTSGVTDMHSMCQDCIKLRKVALFDTSNVTDMRYMFEDCHDLRSVPLFDTSNVTTMYGMLSQCWYLEDPPLFNTHNVTDMRYMFNQCTAIVSVPLYDTSSVTLMEGMFASCRDLVSVPLFDTSHVTTINGMFANCESLTRINLFDMSSITNVGSAFAGCVSVESGILNMYNVLKDKTSLQTYHKHEHCFTNCGSNTTTGSAELAQIPVGWKD